MLPRSAQRGFTLVEVILVIFILTLLVLGVTTLVVAIFQNSRQQTRVLGDIFQSTLLSVNFANELRNASMGSDGSYPLNQAGDSQLIFYSSFGTSTVQRIRYYLATTTLYKGVVSPTGNPPVYNFSSEIVRPIQADVASGSKPIFYYYDGNYSGTSTALAQPVNINQVKFVGISVPILRQAEISTSTYPINIGATIRSLKNNLGN